MWGQEKIDIYWSDKLQEPEKFTLGVPSTMIPNGSWKEIVFDIPEGTRHFAIRCISEIMALFIDDIRYTPKPASATLIGYEILKTENRSHHLKQTLFHSLTRPRMKMISTMSEPLIKKECLPCPIRWRSKISNSTKLHIPQTTGSILSL